MEKVNNEQRRKRKEVQGSRGFWYPRCSSIPPTASTPNGTGEGITERSPPSLPAETQPPLHSAPINAHFQRQRGIFLSACERRPRVENLTLDSFSEHLLLLQIRCLYFCRCLYFSLRLYFLDFHTVRVLAFIHRFSGKCYSTFLVIFDYLLMLCICKYCN
jgi:hypothetical protein